MKYTTQRLQIGRQEHYSCNNCLLSHGVPEDKKGTDEITVEFFNTKINNNIKTIILIAPTE